MSNTAPTRPLALVTGASRGLGFALAAALGARGWHVMAVARTVGGLEELDDRIQKAGGAATLAPMDLTDEKAAAYLANAIAGRWGRVGLWVHTAIHAAPLAPAGHVDARDLAKSVAINLTAAATLIPLIEPLLRDPEGDAHGTALFLDDPRTGQPFFGAYGSTKAAQMSLVRSWQAETQRIGPWVRIVTPKPVATAVRARFFPGEDRAALADLHGEAARILAEIQ